MRVLILFLTLKICLSAKAQYVDLPTILPTSLRVYMATSGNDNNSGDSLNPVQTFGKALDLLVSQTTNQFGEIYTEVVLFEGLYQQALVQPVNKYQLTNRNLNVSVRGIGTVELDGTNLSNLSSGSGMVHLLGSHISVSNVHVLYSPANGIRFGFNYNGVVINPHDITISSSEVMSTSGHGILVGIGALNTANPFILSQMAERFLIEDCNVHDAVNFNTVQSQWGSAIKAWNTRHVTVRNCIVRDNGGEGINFDECDSIDVYSNDAFDNVIGIYLDKVTNAWLHRNYIANYVKQTEGMLFGIEAYTSLITNHYIKKIRIFNNLLLNTQGLAFWQGIYGANQHGYFDQIEILHNTIIGKQSGNGSCIHFNFETFLGQPAPNVHFSQISMERNIVSANPDSLNNNQLIYATLPVPGFSASYNVYSQNIWSSMSSVSDVIDPQIPTSILSIANAVPGSGLVPVHLVPTTTLTTDFYMNTRGTTQTAAGAFELSSIGLQDQYTDEILVAPNPTSGQFKLIGLEGGVIRITDMSGKIVFKNQYKKDQEINLTNLLPGLYLIEIQGSNTTLKMLAN
jgi:parallel beta-helix repeat protein